MTDEELIALADAPETGNPVSAPEALMTRLEVVAFAAHIFCIKPAEIFEDIRSARVHRARLALYAGLWLRAELSGKRPSYSGIGRVMRRDHSTVIHGTRRAQTIMERDADFIEVVCQIALATVNALPTPSCNAELHGVGGMDQQQERTVDNPKYTEERINSALTRAGIKDIEVYWDGDICSEEEPPVFEAYLRDDGTDVFIKDLGRSFDVTRYCSDGVYRPVGDARTFDKLAELLRDEFLSVEVV